jgi:uncharacterized DUF497 family protein
VSEFEWDIAKAESNLRKHGLAFEAACGVFDDAFALDRIDTRMNYEEERFLITGMVRGVLHTVAYAERSGRLRIISARKADRHEQRDYYRSQAPE